MKVVSTEYPMQFIGVTMMYLHNKCLKSKIIKKKNTKRLFKIRCNNYSIFINKNQK